MEAWSVEPRYVPRRLYRVDYEDAMTEYIPGRGFEAAIFVPESELSADPALFIRSIEDHLDWYSEVPSPFISLFSDRWHAENWAQTWSKNKEGQAYRVFEIDGTQLDPAFLFRPYIMKTRLGAEIDNPRVDFHELLYLNYIPEEAIM